MSDQPIDAFHGVGGCYVVVNGLRMPADPVTGLPLPDPAAPPAVKPASTPAATSKAAPKPTDSQE